MYEHVWNESNRRHLQQIVRTVKQITEIDLAQEHNLGRIFSELDLLRLMETRQRDGVYILKITDPDALPDNQATPAKDVVMVAS